MGTVTAGESTVTSPTVTAGASASGTGGSTSSMSSGAAAGMTASVSSGSGGSSGASAGKSGSTEGGAGASATAGAAAGGTGGAAGTEMPVAMKPACLKKASQVIIMGDTFVLWADGFIDALKKESGQTYRDYSLEGAGLGSVNMILGPNLIPPEFDQALSADPDITTALMIGGGTDLLLPDPKFGSEADNCKTDRGPMLDVCNEILKLAFDTGKTLFAKMADKGVKDLVLFFYPQVPKNTLIGGSNPNAMLEYALPMAKALCDGTLAATGGKLKCHFLDLVPVFKGHESDWFQPADIHPNKMGSAAMAKAIVELMKTDCVAQPAGSACCM